LYVLHPQPPFLSHNLRIFLYFILRLQYFLFDLFLSLLELIEHFLLFILEQFLVLLHLHLLELILLSLLNVLGFVKLLFQGLCLLEPLFLVNNEQHLVILPLFVDFFFHLRNALNFLKVYLPVLFHVFQSFFVSVLN
jgi:hypothetical protein